MAKLMRTPLFMAARVVPRMAMATVIAMISMKANPFPARKVLPSWTARSPIGALDAAAAWIPFSVPSAEVSFSFIA
jgi:hypothetical protein